jgi:two-component system cell cycle sensor histidine kinase/response regulator CckA
MTNSTRSQVPGSGTEGIIRVVLLYAAFSALWILLSDKAVEWLFHEPEQITLASTFKGWLFVAVTSLLLYGQMRRMLGPTGTELKLPPVAGRRLLLPMALVAVAIIVLTAGNIVRTFKQETSKEVARLQAIADLKAGQISDWLRERESDGHFVQTSRFFAETYRHWRDAGDTASGDLLKKRLNEYREDRFFEGVLLLDEQTEVLWGSEDTGLVLNPALLAAAPQAAAEGRALRVGPYRDADGRLHLDLVVPLLLVGDQRRPIVVLRVDPRGYLFSILQSWPVPTGSGETLLFRRDGEEVLFLSEHRHHKDTAAKLRVPVAENDPLTAQVLRGEAKLGSLIEGVDYRGVPVMGVARAIPGTDWFLVARMDQAEARVEANRDAIWVALTGLLALLMAAAGFFLFRQHQELAFSLRERETQAEKLRALELLDAIAEGSGDAIFAKDREGRYLLFNREAARVVGKSPREVLGRDDTALFPPEQAAILVANDRKVMEDNRTVTFQEDLTTTDGEVTFLATKGQLHDAAGNVIGMFGISRDITERKRTEEALRESEEKYRRLIETTGTGYVIIDDQGRVTDANQEYAHLTGRQDVEDILGHSVLEWTSPHDRDRNASEVRKCVEQGFVRNLEIDYVTPSGQVIPVEINATVLRASGALQILGVCRDITERKQAEQALRESERRLRRAELVAQLGNWEFMLGSMEVRVSDGARAIYGLGESKWSIPEVQKIPLPEYRRMLDQALRELIEEGKPYNVEFKIQRPTDGKVLDVHSIAEYSPERGVVFGVIQDITKRKRAEEEKRESEHKYRVLFETANDGIFLQGPTGFVDCNQKGASMYGLLRENLIGRSPAELCPERQPDGRLSSEVAAEKIRAAFDGEPQEFEWQALRADGVPLDVEITLNRVEMGGSVLLQAIVRDITDRKRAEEERKKLGVQLFHAQKLESIGRLAGGVAHDFNNMMGVIIGHTELALHQISSSDPLYFDLQHIQKAAHRSADLTRQLLAFARKQTVSPKVIDLNDTISDMLTMLRRLIGEDINLVWLPSPDLWKVRVDPSQIDQILANLTVNARDAILATGSITLSTENVVLDDSYAVNQEEFVPGEYVLLTVGDSGPGMEREVLDHIFEPFFTTKEVGQGTGLGLATVYGIVRQNNGLIEVQSTPGKGTTFQIYLPAFAGMGASPPAEKDAEKAQEGTETILVVEDDEGILNLSKIILETLGYKVYTASTPTQAFDIVKGHAEIDLVIVDVVMPEMNGRELVELLHTIRPDLKFIHMSGYTADVIARRGVLEEGVHFIQKPFSVKAIAKKVREALEA